MGTDRLWVETDNALVLIHVLNLLVLIIRFPPPEWQVHTVTTLAVAPNDEEFVTELLLEVRVEIHVLLAGLADEASPSAVLFLGENALGNARSGASPSTPPTAWR